MDVASTLRLLVSSTPQRPSARPLPQWHCIHSLQPRPGTRGRVGGGMTRVDVEPTLVPLPHIAITTLCLFNAVMA